MRVRWHGFFAVHAMTERERLLSGSTDRFQLERREQAWNRRHAEDASLLGN